MESARPVRQLVYNYHKMNVQLMHKSRNCALIVIEFYNNSIITEHEWSKRIITLIEKGYTE